MRLNSTQEQSAQAVLLIRARYGFSCYGHVAWIFKYYQLAKNTTCTRYCFRSANRNHELETWELISTIPRGILFIIFFVFKKAYKNAVYMRITIPQCSKRGG